MKKIALFFSLLACGSALAASPSPCSVTVPSYCGNFVIGFTGLYWRGSVGHEGYVQVFDPLTCGCFEPSRASNHIQAVNHRYDWGFKVNVGYQFPCTGLELGLTYTDYDSHDRDFVTPEARGFLVPTLGDFEFAPILPIGPVILESVSFDPITLFSLVTPGTNVISLTIPATTVAIGDVVLAADDILIIAPTPTLASATVRDDHRAFDIDFRQHVRLGCASDVNWFGGLRYAHLEHRLNATYTAFNDTVTTVPITADFAGTIPDGALNVLVTPPGVPLVGTVDVPFTASVTADLEIDLFNKFRQIINQRSEFQGIGPRLGFGGTYQTAMGLGVVGEVSTSLLVGNVKYHLDETFVIDTTGTVTTNATGLASISVLDTLEAPGVTPVTVVINATPIALADITFDTPSVAATTFTSHRDFHPDHQARVVPNIDVKLGLSYSGELACSKTKYKVEAGYLASHYFNAQDRFVASGAFLNTHRVYDTSFEGPYVSVVVAL